MSDNEQKYHLTYTIHAHPEGVPKSEVDPQERGGCDCCVFISVVGQPGGPGPLSVAFPSLNGYNGDGEGLTPIQEFQLWSIWANSLMDVLPDGWRRDVVKQAFEATKDAVLGMRSFFSSN